MKLQQEASAKISELAEKAHAEAIAYVSTDFLFWIRALIFQNIYF